MANIVYTNADNKNRNYGGNSGFLTFDRNKLDILRMMQNDPQMATGYLIGNAIGKKYWGDKQAKSRAEANFMVLHPDATKDQFNQYYKAIKSGMSRNDALAQIGLAPMREYGKGDNSGFQIARDAEGNLTSVQAGTPVDYQKALEAYKNNGGNVLYSGRTSGNGAAPSVDNIPRTPQQNGQVPITTKNAGLIGGMVDPQKAYQAMENKATYNPGNTPTAKADYNGVRNQGNVLNGNATPVADVVPPTPTEHGGSIDPLAHGGGGANLGSFQPIPNTVDAAPNLAVDNNPYAAYGLSDESDVNTGGLLQMALNYLIGNKFNNSF